MRRAFLILHAGIFLAGFTGLFGRLITLHETTLVWYRMLFASLCLFCFIGLPRIGLRRAFAISLCGGLLGLHWIFFYGSIKVSNVSIGTVCFALIGFFTALFEPIIYRRRISLLEIFFSFLTVIGLICIFSFDPRYRYGIALGAVSSMIAAFYSVVNKRLMEHIDKRGGGIDAKTNLLYQMIGGLTVVTALIPAYLSAFPTERQVAVFPTGLNLLYLLLLAVFCTALLYLFYIMSLKRLSAFTVSLSYNLEPIYTIILAFIIFGEGREVNASFYAGIALIFLGVLLQTLRAARLKE